jgi:hypothetical protein
MKKIYIATIVLMLFILICGIILTFQTKNILYFWTTGNLSINLGIIVIIKELHKRLQEIKT